MRQGSWGRCYQITLELSGIYKTKGKNTEHKYSILRDKVCFSQPLYIHNGIRQIADSVTQISHCWSEKLQGEKARMIHMVME